MSRRVLWLWVGLVIACEALDWALTNIALAVGLHEGNPLMAPLLQYPLGWPTLVFKLISVIAFAVILALANRYAPRLARVIAPCMLFLAAAPPFRNLLILIMRVFPR